jgi:hypothetical protein
MKLLVMQFSPHSCHIIVLWSKYSLNTKFSNNLVCVIPLLSETKFHTHTKLQAAVINVEILRLRNMWGTDVAVLTINVYIACIRIAHSFIWCSSAKQDIGVGLVGITVVLTLASHEGCKKNGPQRDEYHLVTISV